MSKREELRKRRQSTTRRTQWTLADGKTIAQRAEALIAIAAPEFRDELGKRRANSSICDHDPQRRPPCLT